MQIFVTLTGYYNVEGFQWHTYGWEYREMKDAVFIVDYTYLIGIEIISRCQRAATYVMWNYKREPAYNRHH